MYLLFAFESWLFGVLYENVSGFNKIVKKLLFDESEEEAFFSKKYFAFYFGNMNQAEGRVLQTGVAAITTFSAGLAQRNAELEQVQKTAHDVTQRKVTVDHNLGSTQPIEHYENYYTEQEKKAIKETMVLKVEKKISETFSG